MFNILSVYSIWALVTFYGFTQDNKTINGNVGMFCNTKSDLSKHSMMFWIIFVYSGTVWLNLEKYLRSFQDHRWGIYIVMLMQRATCGHFNSSWAHCYWPHIWQVDNFYIIAIECQGKLEFATNSLPSLWHTVTLWRIRYRTTAEKTNIGLYCSCHRL